MLRRKRKQKLGDHFHRLAFRFGNAGGIFGQLLDAFPLQIASRVVDISPAFAVGENRHAARSQHLHHERSAGTGQTGNDCDHEFLLGNLFIPLCSDEAYRVKHNLPGRIQIAIHSDTLLRLLTTTRRRFLAQCATTAAGVWLGPSLTQAHAGSAPNLQFPAQPRERIAIASYPFREFIAGEESKAAKPMDLKDFAAHVIEKFQINKIEPWTGHFPSTDPKYLEQFRAAVEKARAAVVNIAVDGEHSPYALDRAEREQAIAFSKKWVDNAVAIGSPSIRTNLPRAKDSKPDLDRASGASRGWRNMPRQRVLSFTLENDNPISEDPFFLVALVEKVEQPVAAYVP